MENCCFGFIFVISTLCVRMSDARCYPTPGGIKRFGKICNFQCHCLNNEQCNAETGACTSGCDYEWTGPGCQYRNIALGEDSRHIDNLPVRKTSALGNDRDVTTCSFTNNATTSRRNGPWYALWLPHEVTVRGLVVTTTDRYLPYFKGFHVSVQQGVSYKYHHLREYKSGQMCYQHDNSIPRDKSVHVKCTRDLTGNQIRLQLANTSTQLVVCDFRVYGECRDRTWGENCTNYCGTCHELAQCNTTNGHCSTGCDLGYKNEPKCNEDDKLTTTITSSDGSTVFISNCNNCKECSEGYWGQRCLRACGKCFTGTCDRFNGTCSGNCQPGYKLKIYCDEECEIGRYGNNCSGQCSCKDLTLCRKSDGHCFTDSNNMNISAIAGGTVAIIIVIVIGVLSVVCYMKHLRNRTMVNNSRPNGNEAYVNLGSEAIGFHTVVDVKSGGNADNSYDAIQPTAENEHEYDIV